MKINFLKTGLLLMGIALIGTACHQRPKEQDNKGTNSKGQTASVEVGGFDAVKLRDQMVDIFAKAPKLREIPRVMKKMGASYMAELTLPMSDVEKYVSTTDMSLANGMYAFDGVYANIMGRDDIVAQQMEIHSKFVNKLGLDGEQATLKKYEDLIKKNAGNKDSLNIIVMDAMNELSANMIASKDNTEVYALFYVGSNIEGLYVLTQIAKMAKDDTPVIEFIGNQKVRIECMFQLLELTASNPVVAPIFEKMKPIMSYFDANVNFSAKQLKEVTPLIEQLRKEVVI